MLWVLNNSWKNKRIGVKRIKPNSDRNIPESENKKRPCWIKILLPRRSEHIDIVVLEHIIYLVRINNYYANIKEC
jgi:hypothetical protein